MAGIFVPRTFRPSRISQNKFACHPWSLWRNTPTNHCGVSSSPPGCATRKNPSSAKGRGQPCCLSPGLRHGARNMQRVTRPDCCLLLCRRVPVLHAPPSHAACAPHDRHIVLGYSGWPESSSRGLSGHPEYLKTSLRAIHGVSGAGQPKAPWAQAGTTLLGHEWSSHGYWMPSMDVIAATREFRPCRAWGYLFLSYPWSLGKCCQRNPSGCVYLLSDIHGADLSTVCLEHVRSPHAGAAFKWPTCFKQYSTNTGNTTALTPHRCPHRWKACGKSTFGRMVGWSSAQEAADTCLGIGQ
jgi:hypothetical protein